MLATLMLMSKLLGLGKIAEVPLRVLGSRVVAEGDSVKPNLNLISNYTCFKKKKNL